MEIEDMIKKITLGFENIPNYSKPVSIEITKRVNLFYGLNGTGKTILSNYLKHEGDKREKGENQSDEDYSHCSIEGCSEKEKILVYNQKFIKKNFYDVDSQKGVFTLSSKNIEAEKNIEDATKEKKKLEVQLTEKEGQLEVKKTDKQDIVKKAQEKTWEIKRKYGEGKDALKFCLDGYRGDKGVLFEHIKELPKPKTKPEKSIEVIEKEAQVLKGDETFEPLNSIPMNDLKSIENNPIFKESIIGNENSMLKKLIEKLGNSDWVRKGLEYIPLDPEEITENQHCPFCQEETISKTLAKKMKGYFDDAFEQKLKDVEELKSKYTIVRNGISSNMEKMRENAYIKKNASEKEQLTNQYKNLIGQLEANLRKIEDKINTPSQKIELQNTQNNLEGLNQIIESINRKIQAHNQNIKNIKSARDEIKDTFWEIKRWEYDQTIARYQKDEKEIQSEVEKIEKEKIKLIGDINKQKEIIEQEQKKTRNIQGSIDNINKELSYLGLDNFSIKKSEMDGKEAHYKITRNGQERENNFKTLSEGEKMIISFLYFMELCLGKGTQDEGDREKIIVIDDPISSLSFMYIFNVAMLISEKFFTSENQLFILTHSLYFFNELIKIGTDKNIEMKLYRITRKGEDALINDLKENEIENDYQAYWQVVKDNQPKVALLANSMRNILEYFFGFIGKEKMKDAIYRLNEKSKHDKRYEAFIRYMNRESHYDSANICDTKEINHDDFKKAFKQLFYDTGHSEHYEKYMK